MDGSAHVPLASPDQAQEAVQSQYPQLEEAAKQRLAQEAEESGRGNDEKWAGPGGLISTIQLVDLGALALHLYLFLTS